MDVSSINIENYRGWALKLAAPYAVRSGDNVLDSEAYADACLGLAKAAQGFDESTGFHFSTYARVCIRREIRDGINRRRTVKKVDGESVRITSSSEIAARAKDRSESITSKVQHHEESDRLASSMERIPERNRLVIMARLDGDTLEEIGDRLGITREGVRKIEVQSHSMLRQLMLARSA